MRLVKQVNHLALYIRDEDDPAVLLPPDNLVFYDVEGVPLLLKPIAHGQGRRAYREAQCQQARSEDRTG